MGREKGLLKRAREGVPQQIIFVSPGIDSHRSADIGQRGCVWEMIRWGSYDLLVSHSGWNLPGTRLAGNIDLL